jgi:nitroreductase
MLYNDLLLLLKNRRTARLVDTENISIDHYDKIIDAALTAPSIDRRYPYKIYALTNSPAGIEKKELLVEHFRCGYDRPGDDWEGKEINQALLSGLTLLYSSWVTPTLDPDPQEGKTRLNHIKDTMVSASFAMIAAESLGLTTGFFGSIKDNDTISARLFNNNYEKITVVVTCANNNLACEIEKLADKAVHLTYPYKEQNPWVCVNKHKANKKTAAVVRI